MKLIKLSGCGVVTTQHVRSTYNGKSTDKKAMHEEGRSDGNEKSMHDDATCRQLPARMQCGQMDEDRKQADIKCARNSPGIPQDFSWSVGEQCGHNTRCRYQQYVQKRNCGTEVCKQQSERAAIEPSVSAAKEPSVRAAIESSVRAAREPSLRAARLVT